MIVLGDVDAKPPFESKGKEKEHDIDEPKVVLQQGFAPPPYTPPVPSKTSTPPQPFASVPDPPLASFAGPSVQPVPNVQPSNYLQLKNHNGSIKGQYIINPTLPIPQSVLAEFPAPHKNFKALSHNGSVQVEIWVKSEASVDSKKPELPITDIDAESHNGSVKVKVHADPLHPFCLRAYSKNGAISVAIPRSFVGRVNISTKNGSPKFSTELNPRLVTFINAQGSFDGFIGDQESAGYGKGEWTGPALDLGSHNGNVHIGYDDETPPKGLSGFIEKIFG